MKRTFSVLIVLFLFSNKTGFSQSIKSKPVLMPGDVKDWPFLAYESIQSDGKYISYQKRAFASPTCALSIKSLTSDWLKEIDSVIDNAFLVYQSKIIVLDAKKTLCIYTLGTETFQQVMNVESFQLFDIAGKDILSYTDESKSLHIKDLNSKKEITIPNIDVVYDVKDMAKLFVVSKVAQFRVLHLVDLEIVKEHTIVNSDDFENLKISRDAEQIAYFSGDSLYYRDIKNSQILLAINKNIIYRDTSYAISNLTSIANNGKGLLINLLDQSVQQQTPQNPVIWSYTDATLKSMKTSVKNSFLFYFDLMKNSLIRIEYPNQTASVIDDKFNQYIEIREIGSPNSERMWNENSIPKDFLFDTNLGNRTPLANYPRSISPDGKYLIIENPINPDLDLYNIETKKAITFTNGIRSFPVQEDKIFEDRETWNYLGWLNGDNILLYDNYDIWLFNISNISNFICLTNGYGKKNNITFRIANKKRDGNYDKKDISLLMAFDNNNMKNGFFRLSNEVGKDPINLSMSDHLYGFPGHIELTPGTPIKAKNANTWLVVRQRADSARNVYSTDDFKRFKQITNFYPEQKFNWISSELIKFRTTDNKETKGVLYKPENFDSTKKYPVIINYYEHMSFRLNHYPFPGLSTGDINIPWFVSRGYLIFCPDIIAQKTEPGPSALRSIEGAANVLSSFRFVDSSAMGLCGHSYGGYETNYILAHSKRFAAAVSSSGFADLVSAVGSVIKGSGENYQGFWAEMGQGRIGYSLWERKDLYIKNSPVFDVDSVQTPLLMMANENDGAVNSYEGIRFFMALRRFKKIVWMLMYPGEDHSLGHEDNRLDYTKKLEDFYNHYLKREPKKAWMK
jgi:dipeptidyl aminopeptidase/acylaminoacyl peptidase